MCLRKNEFELPHQLNEEDGSEEDHGVDRALPPAVAASRGDEPCGDGVDEHRVGEEGDELLLGGTHFRPADARAALLPEVAGCRERMGWEVRRLTGLADDQL